MDHIPSLKYALAEFDKLSSTMRPVDEVRTSEANVKPVSKSQVPTVDDSKGVVHSLTSSLMHEGTSLLAATARDLTSIDVTAGGKVDVDGTVTFGIDRNTVLYIALAAFLVVEAVNYF